MGYKVSRLGIIVSAAVAFVIMLASPAHAITIADCVDGGGIVVRCSEQPVTREDKIVCPRPGKAERIWCVGGFYHGLEILELGGRSRYR